MNDERRATNKPEIFDLNRKTHSKTFETLHQVYGDITISRVQVFEWCEWLNERCKEVKDDSRRGKSEVNVK